MRGGHHHTMATLPPGKTPYLLYRKLGAASESVWTGAENLAPHRNVRPVASYYTAYAIPAPECINFFWKSDFKAVTTYTDVGQAATPRLVPPPCRGRGA
jgi:hypothetical protein